MKILQEISELIINNKELLAIALSPVIAVAVGEWLRSRNYKIRRKDDLVCRLISYGFQLSSPISNKKEIMKALNETKYWYSGNKAIKSKIFKLMEVMQSGNDVQDYFIDLIQSIGKEEGHSLTRNDIEKVFNYRF